MKKLLSVFVVLLFISCEKKYTCVCTSNWSNQDTIVDQIKTTKLGSKGYKKTCAEKEKGTASNCHLQ